MRSAGDLLAFGISDNRYGLGASAGRDPGPTLWTHMTNVTSGSANAVHRSKSRRRRLLLGAMVASGVAAGVVARRVTRAMAGVVETSQNDDGRLALGWGDTLVRPATQSVHTPDGAQLAVWDIEGRGGPGAPVVVLPHCWGCSHEIWLPVTRRLHERGYRVVLYDQRGHGESTRGTAPLSIDTLAHDFALVLEATDVRDAVLGGHSMGGVTIMSLATHRPDVLRERGRAVVLVSTAAKNVGERTSRGVTFAGSVIGSPAIARALSTRNGHLLVRGAFGTDPVRAQMVLTRDLFARCDGPVRGEFLVSLASLDLLQGIATIDMPTTVMVGTRDTLTLPKKADQIVATVPGARLVTLQDKGHMLPLEDPDAVTDEIVRAVKG
jgi:pimeloyl-ACP methyl ester carboxylesterase